MKQTTETLQMSIYSHCSHRARWWTRAAALRSLGFRSAYLMSPAQVVLTVNASLAIEKDGNSHSPVEILFDSTAQPLPAGARSSFVSDRQVLYRIGSVYVDMEFERHGNSPRWRVVGQMLDSARPGRPLTGVPVSIMERGRNVA